MLTFNSMTSSRLGWLLMAMLHKAVQADIYLHRHTEPLIRSSISHATRATDRTTTQFVFRLLPNSGRVGLQRASFSAQSHAEISVFLLRNAIIYLEDN